MSRAASRCQSHDLPEIPNLDEASSSSSTGEPGREDARKTQRTSIWSTPTVPNRKTTRMMFQGLEAEEIRPQADKYKSVGWAQQVARMPIFEWSAFTMICVNAIWIGIDAETNEEDLLVNAAPIYQVAENIFCLYFSFEWFVRFKAFRSHWVAFTDSWFVFDSFLVFLMVTETWAMTITLQLAGGTGLNPGVLGILSLVRLSRMARMARLLRTSPELLIMVKGLLAAMKSVIITMGMQLSIIYVFGIAMKQVAGGTQAGERYFGSVFLSMYSLAMHATLLDSPSKVLNDLGQESFPSAALFFFVILLSSLLLLNMLIGVLCEVVSNVSSVEKETLAVSFIREKVMAVFEESGLDKDGDGVISKNELLRVLGNVDATQHLREAGVDVMGLVEFADIVFQSDTLGREFEKELTIADFMKLILQLRGTNTATVKDIVDLRKYMHTGRTETNHLLLNIVERMRHLEQSLAAGAKGQAKAGAKTLSRAATRDVGAIIHNNLIDRKGSEPVVPPAPLPQVAVPESEKCKVLPGLSDAAALREEVQVLSARLDEKQNRIRQLFPSDQGGLPAQSSSTGRESAPGLTSPAAQAGSKNLQWEMEPELAGLSRRTPKELPSPGMMSLPHAVDDVHVAR